MIGNVPFGHRVGCPVNEVLGRGVLFVVGGELVVGEGADGVRHPVAGPAVEGGLDHGSVDQVSEGSCGITGKVEVGGDDLGGG